MKLKAFFASLFMGAAASTSSAAPAPAVDAYGFHFKSLHDTATISLADYKGKVIVIVNTASKCGFTPQYAALEKLYKTYQSRGLVILGVPSNDFGGQEPGSNQEIAHFCQINYGVTFPMTAKIDVVGKAAHPFFIWAREKLGFGSAPKWNFYKYLIDRHGQLVDYYSSVTAPDSGKFIKAVESALNGQ